MIKVLSKQFNSPNLYIFLMWQCCWYCYSSCLLLQRVVNVNKYFYFYFYTYFIFNFRISESRFTCRVIVPNIWLSYTLHTNTDTHTVTKTIMKFLSVHWHQYVITCTTYCYAVARPTTLDVFWYTRSEKTKNRINKKVISLHNHLLKCFPNHSCFSLLTPCRFFSTFSFASALVLVLLILMYLWFLSRIILRYFFFLYSFNTILSILIKHFTFGVA